MKIHEYQAKKLLEEYGVSVPRGVIIRNAAEAWDIANKTGCPLAVKAQVHAGGRGKAGGVKLAGSPAEAESIAAGMIGKRIYSPQTGPEGKEVRIVLLEQGIDIRKEYYLALLVDRNAGKVLAMASREGGVEIEKVAAEKPDAICREHAELSSGFPGFKARRMAASLKINPGRFTRLLESLHLLFREKDCSMLELNPLVETGTGDLVALDAKINFDDNALFRHPEITALRDYDEEEPLEIRASRNNLNYIRLDGRIGCMVNGAGLAMATMDIIKLAGGNPANFLDVGGGASTEQIKNAFDILVADPRVNAVLVNIFGGIMRCDTVAEGIVGSLAGADTNLPIVVRLEGTNVAEGLRILEESGLEFIIADNMGDAAEKVVKAAGMTGE